MKKRFLPLLLAAAMCLGLVVPVSAAETGDGASAITLRTLPSGAVTVSAPTEATNLSLSVWLEGGTPYYQVDFKGTTLVEKSKLGLVTSEGAFDSGFTMGEVDKNSHDETWKPLVGEQEFIRDHYNQVSVPLSNASGTLTVEIRAYDTGVAFRYILPDIPEGKNQYTIGAGNEMTQFAFPAGTYAYTHTGQNQTQPGRYGVENLPNNIFRPMTLLYANGYAMTVCEANLDNYSILKMDKDSSNPHTVKVKLGGDVVVRQNAEPISEKDTKTMIPAGPFVSPWRALVVGESEVDLQANSTLVQSLNEAPDESTYKFSEWVEAGSCQRAMKGDNDDTNVMNNAYLEKMVDSAVERGYRYVLLDTGWQGPENDANCDPRLDPAKLDPDNYPKDKILKEKYFAQPGAEQDNSFLGTGEGCFYSRDTPFKKYGNLGEPGDMHVNIDIPKLCDYANKKGVGILLYVNGTRFFPDDMSGSGGRYRFTPDELFAYFERWGVAGVKPGFVHCDDQKAEVYMQEVVEAAAKHKLVMTVHDKWVPSGIERTYPNLLSAEGIFGDEEKAGVGIPGDIATLFTRPVQGPADHTYCWPGKATKGYALASPIMFRTGLNLLFWYTNTMDIPEKDKPVIDFFDNLPSTWKTSLYLEGKMSEYATYARQSFPDTGKYLPSRWYVGSLTAVDRMLSLPLDFLEAETQYVAEIYYDGPDADPNAGFNSDAKKKQTLIKDTFLVDSSMTLTCDLKAKFGYSARLTKAGDYGDITGIPSYSRQPLKVLLDTVAGLEEPSYVAAAWTALQAEKITAQGVYDNTESTEEEIVAAATALRAALDAYLPTIPLTEAITSTDRLVPNYYTEASWHRLASAIEAGKTLLAGAATREELDVAASAIQAAIDGLDEDFFAELELVEYLSNLDYTAESWSQAKGQQGRIQKDKNRSAMPQDPPANPPLDPAKMVLSLMVDGKRTIFPKGMGMDAPGELYYDLTGKRYEFFQATVGVDAEKQTQGDIVFKVYGDDVLLYESAPSGNGSKNAQSFSVPIAGVKTLKLVADDHGSPNGDWADWADAKFLAVQRSGSTAGTANVAQGKSVEVSSVQNDDNRGEYLNDGKSDTRWTASSDSFPQHAIVNLGKVYDILQFAPTFYDKIPSERAYQYKISTSMDGIDYTPCIDRTANTQCGLVKDRAPQETKGQYVKIEITGSTPKGYASIWEFDVIGVVSAKPAITVQPENQTADEGDTATFSVTATIPDEGALTYQWQTKENGVWTDIEAATAATYETAATAAADDGAQYRCVVTNTKDALDGSSVTTDTAALTVIPAPVSEIPTFTAEPANLTVDEGAEATFTVEASVTDGGTLTYQWQVLTSEERAEWADIETATEAVYAITEVVLSDSGAQYRCVVTNAKDELKPAEATTRAALLTVEAVSEEDAERPTIDSQPADQTVTEGKPATFAVTASVTGDGVLTYQWQKLPVGESAVWAGVEGATEAEYTTEALTLADSGAKFHCVVTNTENGKNAKSVTTNDAVLTVNEEPAPTPVEDVTLNKTTLALTKGGSETLIATVKPDDANQNVTWSSDNEAVATVDENGKVTAVAVGTATITATSTDNSEAFDTCAVTVEEAPYVPPYNPPSNTTTETEKNEDGSTTKTVTNKKTGEVKETTTYPDGTKIVATTPKDGSTSIEVTVPKDKDSVTVTVPTTEKPKAGEVAVIIHEDGTREIVKTSVATEDGLRITLDGSAKLEIVDNGKTFADVSADHWGADAIAFVTSRELFNGGDTGFQPAGDMSRAMLFTVLARLDGRDTEDGDTWYTKAMDWAKEAEISDGTNPDASITRESLAVMLYRYAGSPEVGGMALGEFEDADSISGWATDAMLWCVGSGILTGSASKLNPNSTATRAEVAAMLERFISASK